MPDANDAFSTLDDFLLSLADGVTQAQTELARAGAMGPPGAQFSYHLPRVEFELKLNLRVVEDSALSSRYEAIRPARPGDRHLMFRPANPGSAPGSSSTLDIAATLSGALVAVPANDGLPGLVLTVAVDMADVRVPLVQVQARNTAGEALAGLAVEFNVDREETLALAGQASGASAMNVADGTGFAVARVLTDATGLATGQLLLGDKQMAGWLAVVVDCAGRTEQLVVEVRA
ncbi:hypothetical protein BurJ1DRAFT_0631 [Burkholderiales bacterium JOSHI_001]|nr:hypothetical protein BurJ1DRAFT_0631 [Burkholderiales bacterium JOSHI_001]